MSARPFYETVYHRNDWQLADAFRPQPGWGSKRFTVPANSLPPHTDREIIAAARDGADEGYRLTSVTLYPENGPESVLWSTPPDIRFAAKAAAQTQEPKP